MQSLIENLLLLQEAELKKASSTSGVKDDIEALRRRIPESILVYFDRWIRRGKNAVAIARRGVCGECHLKIPVGVLSELAMGDAIEHCGNCGRILYLPEQEALLGASTIVTTKPARQPKSVKRS
jgi:predicted  nucleic acid-binding Zn-ribbon protein